MSAVAVGSPPESRSRTIKLVAAIIAGVAVVVWLVLFVTVGGDFYLTVEEANAAATPLTDARVGGQVAADSVRQEGNEARFLLEGESGATLEVRYVGPFPDRLRAHEQAVVRGSRESGGILEATEVLIKCPDSLFPEKVTNTVLSGAGLERLLY